MLVSTTQIARPQDAMEPCPTCLIWAAPDRRDFRYSVATFGVGSAPPAKASCWDPDAPSDAG